jgi:glycyl-tRNA synthetase
MSEAAVSKESVMEKLVSLCKRRGFIFPSSEIYGGLNSCYDYGPLGVELKRNVKDAWWNSLLRKRTDIEGLDSSILMSPKIWEASGHVAGFVDPLVDCKKCRSRFRADAIPTQKSDGGPDKCPKCGGELTAPRQFNLMFKTFMGPLEEQANVIYLRPETAQGIYVNFLNVQTTARRKVPFGIAQIGKAFRNEITPGNFIFRTREFEQMEMQFFVKPQTAGEWMESWRHERFQWYLDHGIRKEKLQFHQHGKNELAHYAADAFDIQYEFPFGWQELEGIHNRTDFDLKRHQESSGKNLQYFDEADAEKYIPYIIETSAGCDRSILCFLVDAFREEAERVVLSFSPKIAPIKAAIFPLVKKDGMPEIATKIYDDLRQHFNTDYDDSGSVGKRYRRHDEVGTPYAFTIDTQSVADQTVTVRYRDSMKQERLSAAQLRNFIEDGIAGKHP